MVNIVKASVTIPDQTVTLEANSFRGNSSQKRITLKPTSDSVDIVVGNLSISDSDAARRDPHRDFQNYYDLTYDNWPRSRFRTRRTGTAAKAPVTHDFEKIGILKAIKKMTDVLSNKESCPSILFTT